MQQQGEPHSTTCISTTPKRKPYSEPELFVLGKVSDLTAGGSGVTSEYAGQKPNGDPRCNKGQPFQADDRC